MHDHPSRRHGAVRTMVGLALALSLAATMVAGAGASPGTHDFQGENGRSIDLDARKGTKQPTAGQKAAAAAASVRWNRLGTPQSVTDPGSFLATGLSANDAIAARQYLEANRDLFGLSQSALDDLELVSISPIGAGAAVLYRQTFGGLPAGRDGLVSIGIVDGKVASVSSSLAVDTTPTGSVKLSAEDAVRAASTALGKAAGAVSNIRVVDGVTIMDVEGYNEVARAQLVGVPTPTDGVRQSWDVELLDNGPQPLGAISYVDAETGALLARESIIEYADDNPAWKAFAVSPPLDYSSTDTRQLLCWNITASVPGCQRAVANSASPLAWDVDAVTGLSTLQTRGNNSRSTEKWNTNSSGALGTNYSSSATRDYVYPWTNQWYTARCNPAAFASPQQNDIDAARASLFVSHNLMHDWSFQLGFTEAAWNGQEVNFTPDGLGGDAEHGNAQAGGIVGGPPTFASRDNANQGTPRDGLRPVTNMYLWQPVPASFYTVCVDGDYDMSVIAHEYGHMISNRMVAGPNSGIAGAQGGAMGESWSDLAAIEFLNSQGLVPLAGENPYAVGAYVTTDHSAGIRNYGMNASPLNYSDVGYDVTGPQVHADGEIWSAANFDIRSAMMAAYDGSFPSGDLALQRACVAGTTPVAACPGNRRWMQLVFDSYLLMAASSISMIDARDAMLAADAIRFGGANQALLWNAFAKNGFGQNAVSDGSNDADPTPSFESPHADEAVVTFKSAGDAEGYPVSLFVGDYEGRATPIADTDPATALPDTFRIVAGSYQFVARGAGFGSKRFTFAFGAGQVRDLPVNMPRNLASATSGATATGDGINLARLIDDTEATNWASLTGDVAGKQVTVRLDPSQASHQVRRVQVSALLRPAITGDPDAGGQNRFTALRQFEIWTCEAKGAVDCSLASQFTKIFTSPADAFPAIAPRPRAPQLTIRSFVVPQTKATHVRLVVVHNQCTGAPAYQGDQDDDPLNTTDCDTTTIATQAGNGTRVRASELQVFAQ